MLRCISRVIVLKCRTCPAFTASSISSRRTMASTTDNSASDSPRIVLITGCSSGIGLETATLFAKDSQKRFLVYGSILDSLEKESTFSDAAGDALNDTLFPVQMDVTKDEDVSAAVEMVMEKHGRIDILVNNAGIASKKALETIAMEDIKRLFDINFFGYLRMMREVLPIMKRQQSGRIINMSSRNAIEGAPYMNIYTASKFAVEGLSEETAVIGRFFNIWVSLVQPGGVITPLSETMASSGLGYPGSKGISDHPDVHEIDRKLSRYRDHDLEWSKCPQIPAKQVAEIVLRAATEEKPHFRYPVLEAVEALAARKYCDPTGDEFIDYQADRLRVFYGKEPTKK